MDDEDDLITPERLAKGDMEVTVSASNRIIYAQTTDNSILGYLVEREIIEAFQADYAKRFLDMKRAFTSRLDYITLRSISPGMNEGDLESVYFLTVKLLGPIYEGMVMYSLTEARTDASQRLAYRQAGKFEEAFCALVCAIDEANKIVKEEKERLAGVH